MIYDLLFCDFHHIFIFLPDLKKNNETIHA